MPIRRLPAARLPVWFVVVLTVLAVSTASLAQKHSLPRSEKHEYKHQIENLEETWRTAMLNGNSSALANLLAEDYTAITAAGAVESKKQALDNMRVGVFKLTSLEVSDRKVRVYHSTAVVTSVAEVAGTRNDQSLDGRYRYTRVYVRNAAGQWKIVSFEVVHIADSGDKK